jgi:hypothetical protein
MAAGEILGDGVRLIGVRLVDIGKASGDEESENSRYAMHTLCARS